MTFIITAMILATLIGEAVAVFIDDTLAARRAQPWRREFAGIRPPSVRGLHRADMHRIGAS